MALRLVVRITAADVGSRVSVRRRLAGGATEASMTDTVGRLLRWSEGILAIERRDGSVEEVPEADLLAGKVLPEMSYRPKRGYARNVVPDGGGSDGDDHCDDSKSEGGSGQPPD